MKKIVTLIFLTALTLAACSSDYTVLQSFESVILTADSSNPLRGTTVTFTAKDNTGTDHTDDATFYVDGEAITGNTLTSDSIRSFTVTAKYYNIASEPVVVSFTDGSDINFRKRLLIEDFTGTWCGYCTRVAYAIELVHAQTDDAVSVAIHRPSSNVSSANYDPYNYDASELEATLSAVGYPKGYLNRRTRWKNPEPNNIAQAIALTQGENPKLGLALNPVVSDGNISVDVSVKFSKDFTGLKLVVYVLENGLIYEQHNYTDYYDSVDVIEDYHHNHVLRACLTSIMGDAIADTETTLARTYTRTFTAPLPANVANAANVEFVAFIVDASGKAINVRKAAPGDTQVFEEL